MKKDELIHALKEFELDESEANAYVALLSLGPTSVQRLSDETHIKRTTCYPVLRSLKEKGLVGIEVRGLKQLVAAKPPEQLETILGEKQKRLRNIIPQLSSINSFGNTGSFIKYYEGIKGIHVVYDEILNKLLPGDEYLIISDQEKFMEIDRPYFADFIKRRAKLDLKIRALFQDSKTVQVLKEHPQDANWSIRLLPQGTSLTANLVILPTKIVITQIPEPIVCIVIENKSVANMQREQFNIMWKSLA